MYICEACNQLKDDDEMATETLCRYCDMRRDESPEAVDNYLRAAGYDPDMVVKRMQKRLKPLLDKVRQRDD